MNYSARKDTIKAESIKHRAAEMAALDMVKARWDAVPWGYDMAELQDAMRSGRSVTDAYRTLMADLEALRGLAKIAEGIDAVTQDYDVNRRAVNFKAAIMRAEDVLLRGEYKVAYDKERAQ